MIIVKFEVDKAFQGPYPQQEGAIKNSATPVSCIK